MKKIVSVLLTLCMLVSMGAMLSSCKHTCVFSEDWIKDETSHWHACTHEDCVEISDKGDHVWNEGEITTKATQEAEGVKTFTCTTCAQTKTEAVVFTGLSKEEWDAAFDKSVFENFTYEETATAKGVTTTQKYKVTKEKAWVKIVQGSHVQSDYTSSRGEVEVAREKFLKSLKELTPYESFQYDAQTKTYRATESLDLETTGLSADDVTLTFTDGKLTEVSYRVSKLTNGTSLNMIIDSHIVISDYGTTTVAN